MILAFDDIELDADRAELRQDGEAVSVEPRVFALLMLLARNPDRLISRDELIEKVWDNRVISDSALSTGIKAARKAVGDDGSRQTVIKTVHGRGFRFIASVKLVENPPVVPVAAVPVTALPATVAPTLVDAAAVNAQVGDDGTSAASELVVSSVPDKAVPPSTVTPAVMHEGKPSLAVLPFQLLSVKEGWSAVGDAIPAELISSLSRLRWLFVTARGSSFRFRQTVVDPSEVRSQLNVAYLLTGMVEMFGDVVTVTVELADTSDGSVLWAERYSSSLDDIHETRSSIVTGVIAAMEIHIPLNEANLARVQVPENLDAWSLYHVGLQHLYRFNKADNVIAANYFTDAIGKEPDFARAHAGLSFTSFQNVFLKYEPDVDRQLDLATRSAERSLELDPLDPFGNFNMARTHWLSAGLENSRNWLDRTIQLSPNFAQGHYARGWVDTMLGDSSVAREHTGVAMTLSPLDPLYYAMLATTALSHIAEGNTTQAVVLADRAARSPGAHHLIGVIAAVAHAQNGSVKEAEFWVRDVRNKRGDIDKEMFFSSFPFQHPGTRAMLETTLLKLGF